VTVAIVLSVAVGALAFIVSVSKISRPARIWMATDHDGPWWRWVNDLVNCPFCLSVWMGLAAAAVYRPRLLGYYWPLGYLGTALAISGASMLTVLVIRRAVA
jgi:hypothetical protein